MTWNYIQTFGKDSKNFQDIFQIIISSFFNHKIECQFQFPNDDKFFISISEHIKEIYNQLYITFIFTIMKIVKIKIIMIIILKKEN